MKQRQAKQGFVLVEWMVQFLLLTILSIISYSLVTVWHTTILRTNRLIADLLPVYLAADVMRSDIAQGDPDTIRVEGDKVHLMHNDKRIQWQLNKQKLFRISGSYDQQQKRWRKPAKSLVAHTVQSGDFMQQHGDDRQINIKLQTKYRSDTIKQIMTTRNGYVV